MVLALACLINVPGELGCGDVPGIDEGTAIHLKRGLVAKEDCRTESNLLTAASAHRCRVGPLMAQKTAGVLRGCATLSSTCFGEVETRLSWELCPASGAPFSMISSSRGCA